MEPKDRALLKNRVLNVLVQNKGNYKRSELFEILEKPMASLDIFASLIEELVNEGSKYVTVVLNSTNGRILFISENHLTKEFLKAGGFVNMYESQLEAELQAASIADQEQTIRDLNEKNLDLSNQVANLKLKTYLIPLIISGISAAIAFASLIYVIYINSSKVSQFELRTIESKIDSIKIDFKKENEKLKSRIYEAEMLIAVYESDSLI